MIFSKFTEPYSPSSQSSFGTFSSPQIYFIYTYKCIIKLNPTVLGFLKLVFIVNEYIMIISQWVTHSKIQNFTLLHKIPLCTYTDSLISYCWTFISLFFIM